MTYYRILSLGNPEHTVKARFPGRVILTSKEEAETTLARWWDRAGWLAGTAVDACTVRIYGYSTRKAAEDGSLAHDIGENGRVE